MVEHYGNSVTQSWGGRDGREETGNEGHFSTYSSTPAFPTTSVSSQQSHYLISHPIFFSHILPSLPDSLIPFQICLVLCFYFSINPDFVLYIY